MTGAIEVAILFPPSVPLTLYASGTGMLKASAGSSRSTALANARPAGLLKPASYLILMHPAAFRLKQITSLKSGAIYCATAQAAAANLTFLTFLTLIQGLNNAPLLRPR